MILCRKKTVNGVATTEYLLLGRKKTENDVSYVQPLSFDRKIPIWLDENHTIRKAKYIESTGTQYIDTGYSKPNKNCIVETKLSYSNITTRYLIGVSNSSPNYFGRAATNGKFELNGVYTNIASSINIPCVLKYIATDSDTILEVNNGTSSETLTSGSIGVISNRNWCVCGNNGNDIATFIHSGNIYYFKLIDNSVLVRNFLPAYNTTTNKYGLYDTVNNQWYGNSGTGDFTGEIEYDIQ